MKTNRKEPQQKDIQFQLGSFSLIYIPTANTASASWTSSAPFIATRHLINQSVSSTISHAPSTTSSYQKTPAERGTTYWLKLQPHDHTIPLQKKWNVTTIAITTSISIHRALYITFARLTAILAYSARGCQFSSTLLQCTAASSKTLLLPCSTTCLQRPISLFLGSLILLCFPLQRLQKLKNFRCGFWKHLSCNPLLIISEATTDEPIKNSGLVSK